MDNLPIRFKEASDEVKTEIINIGTAIYYNGLKWLLQDEHEARIEKLNIEKESYSTRIAQIKEQYALQLQENKMSIEQHYQLMLDSANNNLTQTRIQHTNLLDEQRKSMKEANETIISNLHGQINELKEQLFQVEHQVKGRYEDVLGSLKQRVKELEQQPTGNTDIVDKLDSLLGKKSAVDNAAKGDFGEQVVYNQILHYYPASVLEDTSGITASGDMHWKMHNDAFRCLVEVKNVQNVRASDLQKFDRDLAKNVSDGTVNCGLFISLKTEHIPNKGQFHFEFLHNVPTIYVADVFADMNILRISMHILQHVQSILTNDDMQVEDISTEHKTYIINHVQYQHEKLLNSRKNISQMKHAVEHLSNTILNEEKSLNELMLQVMNLNNNISWIDSVKLEQPQPKAVDKKRKLVDAVYDFYMLNNRWPTTREIENQDESIKTRHFRGNFSMQNIRNEVKSMIDL